MAAMNSKLNCMQFLIDNLKIDVDIASETGIYPIQGVDYIWINF